MTNKIDYRTKVQNIRKILLDYNKKVKAYRTLDETIEQIREEVM